MSKYTAVIFDTISDRAGGVGDIACKTEDFRSGSVALCGYDTISRKSSATVLITTRGGNCHTIVGTFVSVLENFKEAAQATEATSFIASTDMIPALQIFLDEFVIGGMHAAARASGKIPTSESVNVVELEEARKPALENIKILIANSAIWRSELK